MTFEQNGKKPFSPAPTADFTWTREHTTHAELSYPKQTAPPPPDGVQHRDAAGVTKSYIATDPRTGLDQNVHGTLNVPHCGTPTSSVSGESMHNHVENATPPESPVQGESPGASTTAYISRLSLDHDSANRQSSRANHDIPTPQPSSTAPKRAASPDRPPQKRQPLSTPSQRPTTSARRGRATAPKRGSTRSGEPQAKKKYQPVARDSGYESAPSRANTLCPPPPDVGVATANGKPSRDLPTLNEQEPKEFDTTGPTSDERYPGLMLQPESSPISKDQLAAEVKGIYAGLAMVEAKCINIDAAQASDPDSKLGPEQWQALIALHRTLLYEHHDFLMATQHPSATPALRGLAYKYSMPARMWRHGIHAFLEVLRHRRRESQDYMLAFIYLAYQMMALLFETVPAFTDTWIECLGDLARYRMAIEEEREAHSIWGGVAGRWYSIASDRHPSIGRLYHHLGILERPSLRKFCLYAKSLTSVIPFPNASDSLATFCTPVAQEQGMQNSGTTSAEAKLVAFHALVSTNGDDLIISQIASDALSRLSRQATAKIKDIGVELVTSNISALLELGSPSNLLWQLFTKAVQENIQSARPSVNSAGSPMSNENTRNDPIPSLASTNPSALVIDFCYSSFNAIIRLGRDRQSIRETLPSLHTVLIWMHALHFLGTKTCDDLELNTYGPLVNPDQFDLGGLCDYLNLITQLEPIGARTLEFARQGMFLVPERSEDARPLAEDYLIRGLIWSQFLYPSDWFDKHNDDDGRSIETSSTHKARVERVQWLGLYLAFRLDGLDFDLNTRSFYVPVSGLKPKSNSVLPGSLDLGQDQSQVQSKPSSRSSGNLSAHSDSDGYAVISSSRAKPVKTWANVASKRHKVSMNDPAVRVVDDEYMEWS